MHWIIQSNLFNEVGYTNLINTLERLQLPHTIVKVIPFSHTIDPIPTASNPIAVMGSTSLVRIGKEYGWGPGLFWDEELTFNTWKEHWGTHLLNHDSEVCKFSDIKFDGIKFIRPIHDLKTFSGEVIDSNDFGEWQEKVLQYDDGLVNSETLCAVAIPKVIHQEFRFFVLDGKVLTGSRYKLGDRVTSSGNVDQYITDYAQARVDEWQPDRGFVIDIALTDDGCKVIEINNLNSAGFYECDLSKIIQSIDEMEY